MLWSTYFIYFLAVTIQENARAQYREANVEKIDLKCGTKYNCYSRTRGEESLFSYLWHLISVFCYEKNENDFLLDVMSARIRKQSYKRIQILKRIVKCPQ